MTPTPAQIEVINELCASIRDMQTWYSSGFAPASQAKATRRAFAAVEKAEALTAAAEVGKQEPRLSKYGNFMPIDTGQECDPPKPPPFHIGGPVAERPAAAEVERNPSAEFLGGVAEGTFATIERCAQVAEAGQDLYGIRRDVAAAIRALKDEP